MMSIDQLQLAVQIQSQTYQLLQWVSAGVTKGFLKPGRAHIVASSSDAALAWLEAHLENLPVACRPADEHRLMFAQFFASYLETSFDLVTKPGMRLVSYCGCYCSMCSRFANAPHLQLKKLGLQDKRKAARLRLQRLGMLAVEEKLLVSSAALADLSNDAASSRDAALSAYGWSLLERLRGICRGSGVLALWREIAWNRKGAPIPGFQLSANDIHEAELRLTGLMKPLSLS